MGFKSPSLEAVFDGGALQQSLRETYADYEAKKLQPGSENWKDFSDQRRQLMNDVRKKWATLTGLDPREFPYTPASIHRHWTKARKNLSARK